MTIKNIGILSPFLILALTLVLGLPIDNAISKEVPALTGPVVDQVALLPPAVSAQIQNSLKQYQLETGNQIQLLIVDSLEDESLEGYSIKVTDTWKLGDEKKDNGILFLVAFSDRKLRIEVGQGLEGVLTDAKSGRIIDMVTPYFKKGDYTSGIVIGLSVIAKTLGGELKSAPIVRKRKRGGRAGYGLFFTILMILFIFTRGGLGSLFLLGAFGGMGSSYRGGSWRGGGGGGFSGGGGWSGGGGGFSGGGASGGW